MDKIEQDQLTNLEKEEFAVNCVGFKLEEYKDLKNVFSYGIRELRSAISHDIVSISEASKIAKLPKEHQLEALKRLGYTKEKDLPNVYDDEIIDLINDMKGKKDHD
ncbi:hypothetical protein [Rickettsiella massiliensis]|uniref:hypothetical protein n=1 Tax=Rickettsiella massiliensis TaxID=676517 RepID=UPI00029A6B5B|nr:hypothetical protein [Rickettsiella massiliensis]